MTRRIYSLISIVLLVCMLASCSSSRLVKKSQSIEGMSEMEYVENVLEHAGGWDALTAKMSLSFDWDGQGATKVNGTLRVKKGEVIQLSIAPLLGVEVARVEIAPHGVLVIDRMNKRYVQVSFSELKTWVHADLDFHTLQALFLNEVFLPGKGGLTARDASAFKVEIAPEGVSLGVKKAKRFTYRFLTQAPEAWLKESCIGLAGTPYQLKWVYDDFRSLGTKQFPSDMQVSFEGGKKPVTASFALSRLSMNSNWKTHTEVSSKYNKVELADLLKLLFKK